MKIIKQPIPGTIMMDGDVCAIRYSSSESDEVVFLSYALTTLGPGHRVLPSVLLDDWGKEIGGLAFYRWIRDHGQKFPRAEVFGLDPTGAEVQYFLRDLELLSRYPVYAFTEENAPANAGVPIRAILIPDDAADTPQSISPPGDIDSPLREAQVEWWRVNSHKADLRFLHRSSITPE